MFDQDTWFGRTYTEHSVPTKEKTSELSWKKWQGSGKKPSLFLDLRKGNGLTADASWETVSPSHGECSMHSTGEFLNVGSVSALSLILMDIQQLTLSLTVNTEDSPVQENKSHLLDVLQLDADPKYNLSPKACRGILRRALKRGKNLPQMLYIALMQTIERAGEMDLLYEDVKEYLPSKNEVANQGGVKEYSSKMTEQGHSHRSISTSCTDVKVYENHSQDSRYVELGGVSETVTQKYGTGGNNQPLVVRRLPAVSGNGKNGGGHPSTQSILRMCQASFLR